MKTFALASGPLTVLCLGAHSDDIEIGCGGTVLRMLATRRRVRVVWVVLAASGDREREAQRSAAQFLRGAAHSEVIVKSFRDGFLPYQGTEVKEFFETLKRVEPDLVFTHSRQDRHQDHRLVSDLTWNTFRNHSVLEYEIPKYDGDLGQPNVYVPLSAAIRRRKVKLLMSSFASQRSKRWFTESTFEGLMRLRGVESGDPQGYAEAFFGPKLAITP